MCNARPEPSSAGKSSPGEHAATRAAARAATHPGARRRLALVLVWLLAAATLLAFLFAPSPGLDDLYSGAPVVDLSPAQSVSAAPTQGGAQAAQTMLRLAVAPVISPEQSLEMYRELVDFLAAALGRRGELLLRPTYAEVNALVERGASDLAFVCTWAFIQGERDFGMQAVLVPVVGGSTTYKSFVIVPAESKATSLFDLRGLRFASADIKSTSGWLWPARWLKRRGEAAESFFGEHVITGSHDRSVLAVAEGLADGAAVSNLVYEQVVAEKTALRSRIKVIGESPPYGMPPLVVHPGIDPALRARLVELMTTMHENPRGRKILAQLRIERFAVPPPNLWASVREHIREWEGPR